MGLATTEALDNLAYRVDTPGIKAFVRGDQPGRDARRLDQPDPAQPRRRDAQAAQGGGRGARPEGADQDAVPAHLPDLPGDVRRPAPARPAPDLEDARVAERWPTPRNADTAPRGRADRLRLRHRRRQHAPPHARAARAAHARRPGEGIVLRPAWSIHTAFMRFPIDVVFVDADQVVMRIEPTPAPVQDGLVPRRARGRRAARRRVRAARARGRRPRRLGLAQRRQRRSRSQESPVAAGRAAGHGARRERRPAVRQAGAVPPRGPRASRSATRPVPVALAGSLEDADVDAVLLDAGTSLGDGLRLSNAARAQRPELPVVLVAEAPGEQAPESVARLRQVGRDRGGDRRPRAGAIAENGAA